MLPSGDIMQRRLLPLFALLLAANALIAPARAQTAPPVVTVQPQSDPANLTLKTGAQLVIVDVTVTGTSQAPIHNLKVSDFTVLEDNTPQRIRDFEEHLPSKASHFKPLPPDPPGIFSNYSPSLLSGSLSVLVLDALNSDPAANTLIRSQVARYLQSAPDGTRIAIFGLTTRLNLLQGFSSDPATLKSALAATPSAAPTPTAVSLSRNLGDSPSPSEVAASLQQLATPPADLPADQRTKDTLDAMSLLARYLSGLPGRKNLIWLSQSFPINLFPDGTPVPGLTPSSQDELRETTNLLRLAQVAVYPIDVRKLLATPGDTIGSSNMEAMAQQSGGLAIASPGDLATAIADAISSGSNFYTLTYSPTSTDWNGQFRKIEIKLSQPGYTLSYRRGYYADDPAAPPRRHDSNTAKSPNAPDSSATMRDAMLHGAPAPTQIPLKLRVLPSSTSDEESPAAGNTVSPEAKATTAFRRYSIDYAADPRRFIFHITPDGVVHGSIQFLTYVYDQDGKLINVSGQTLRTSFSQVAYGHFLQTGLPYHQEISVPVDGTYYLRIAVHDLDSDRVGVVELPVAAVKNLQPLTPSGTTSSPSGSSAPPAAMAPK
jgi:VWFA-related protein